MSWKETVNKCCVLGLEIASKPTISDVETVTTISKSGTTVDTESPPVNCDTSFKFPTNCRARLDCDYEAEWRFNRTTQLVDFSISAKSLGRWTGIGFSPNGTMVCSG